MVKIEASMADEISRGSAAAKRHISNARTAAKKIEQTLGVLAEFILLDDLVEVDSQLVACVEEKGIDHQSAVQYVCEKNKLLDQAHAVGWTCEGYELRQSWRPIRAALEGHARGALGIVDAAIRSAVRPREYTEQPLIAWIQTQMGHGRSPLTVTADECNFRKQLRDAGLQKSFPGFDLSSKNPEAYTAKLSELDPRLRRQIETLIRFKTAEHVRGRDAKLAIRPPSARNLLRALLQLCGYAIHTPGLLHTKLTSLLQVVVPKVISPFIDWLLSDRKCKKTTITSRLSSIHYLACSHALFGGRDYSWIRTRLNQIEKEPKHLLEERKKRKYVRYDLFASIPLKIRNERLGDKLLSPVELAWSIHDELFISWWLYLPWRQRNLRELAISGPEPRSLIHEEIPTDLKHQLELPEWANNAWNRNKRREFWQFTFRADQTKGKRAVRDIVPREPLPLLTMYLKTYRPELVRAGEKVGVRDPGTLFLNRDFGAMSNKDVLALLTRLTVRYTGTRVTPHLVRDIFSANFLEKGGKMDDLRKLLWQADIATTQTYCKRFNASSHAAVCVDEYFARIDPGRLAHN
jgi:hypothetical protein